MIWEGTPYEGRFAFVRKHVVQEGLSFTEAAALARTTKNSIAGFVHHARSELYSSNPVPRVVKRRYKGRAKPPVVFKAKPEEPPNPVGRPMAIPHGSDKERELRSLWAQGRMIKGIAYDLRVSQKTIKNAVSRLKLPTRRANLGKVVDLRIKVTVELHAKLVRRANERGSSLARLCRLGLTRISE